MTVAGHIYGVILNDRDERDKLDSQFIDKPYVAAPIAPVVFMKPRGAVSPHQVQIPVGSSYVASATVALLFASDATGVSEAQVSACIGGMALAVDLSLPQANYYRPSVAERMRDGSMLLGSFVTYGQPGPISTFIDGAQAHSWSLDRLVRPVEKLVADLSAFMTLRAGDILMVGLPGDAPVVAVGQALRVEAQGLPNINASIVEAQL